MFKNYLYNEKAVKHSFDINNVDLSIINGIRRTILTDIPVIGFIGEDDPTVDIINSNGPLHDELLIHRIGLIPLHLNEEQTESYVDNDLEFELNITNDNNNIKNVYTNSITGTNKGVELTKKELQTIFPPNNITKSYILITRLRTGEYLNFKAKAVKRTARLNASFSPVSLCNLFYNQDESLIDESTDILDKERLYYKNKYGDPTSVKFEIESLNGLPFNYLIIKSIEIITDKLNKLRENILNDKIKIEQFQDLENTYDFYIENEDDTLGNIVQSLLHNKYIRENQQINNIKCKYVGYICPHPLKYLLIIRLTLEDQKNKSVFINFLDSNCKLICEDLMRISIEFNKFISTI